RKPLLEVVGPSQTFAGLRRRRAWSRAHLGGFAQVYGVAYAGQSLRASQGVSPGPRTRARRMRKLLVAVCGAHQRFKLKAQFNRFKLKARSKISSGQARFQRRQRGTCRIDPPACAISAEGRNYKSQNERTPSVTWRQLWLDFVADTQTMDDPAPFCWPEFQSAVVKVVPIFSPNATPSECNTTMTDIQAAQAYATTYWASDDRIKFDRAAAKNQHAAGRKAVIDYLHKKRAGWHIQSKTDEALEENGITMHAIAQPDLGGIPPAERGFPVIPALIDKWFGGNVEEYQSREAAWNFCRQLLGITWQRWRKTVKRDRGAIDAMEAEVQRTTAECAKPDSSEEAVKAHFQALQALVTKLAPYQVHPTKGRRRYEILKQLKGMAASLNNDIDAPELTKIPKALQRALEHMPSVHDAELMLARI
ncbi:hypothetical protein PYCCODRAFT_1429262, partial [Trametes coccinea BRFM310]